MTRFKAAGLHLFISIVLACAMGALLYFVWFPKPWFVAAGASTLILLLMGVDVCIGPLLTLIAFNPNKRRSLLRLDLTVIMLLQTIAFFYGLSVITHARPVFIVAEVDRYVVVAADQIADADLAQGKQPAFRQRSWHGPRLVGAVPPASASIGFIKKVLATGKDIDRLPRFYVAYSQVADALMQHARPLSTLHPHSTRQRQALQHWQARAAQTGMRLGYLPVTRQDHDYTAIVDRKSAKPLAVLAIDPWLADTVAPTKSTTTAK